MTDKLAEKTGKMVRSKLRLLERFRRAAPRVSGGRERLPPGQHKSPNFPVLDLGIHPPFDPATWRLEVSGEVERPLELTWEEFTGQPRVTQVSDFHCVTTWSTYGLTWTGVAFRTLTELVRPTARATHVIQFSFDGYTTNLPLSELGGADVLLAFELDGKPLPIEHGGPMRLLVPHLYGWKSAKFLKRLVFQDHDSPGYWERLGYHDRGDPWTEERFR